MGEVLQCITSSQPVDILHICCFHICCWVQTRGRAAYPPGSRTAGAEPGGCTASFWRHGHRSRRCCWSALISWLVVCAGVTALLVVISLRALCRSFKPTLHDVVRYGWAEAYRWAYQLHPVAQSLYAALCMGALAWYGGRCMHTTSACGSCSSHNTDCLGQ